MRQIRRALPKDAFGIHQAHMRSIQEVCYKDHSPEEIAGWGGRPYREDQRLNAILNQCVWVLENSDQVEGYGHLVIRSENGVSRGHVMGLYLVPEANGHGYARGILEKMFEEARKHNVVEINLESTLTAHGFYSKMGFKDSGEMASIQIGGSDVRYIPMTLRFGVS